MLAFLLDKFLLKDNTMKWILLLCLTLFSSLSITQVQDDSVVAEVNGKKILKSTLLKYHTQNLNFVKGSKKVTLESSLNDLINRTVGIDEGKAKGVDKRADVIKKMNDIIYHATISDELAPLLQKITVSDNDVKEYYKDFPEYKTSQILLRLRTQPSKEEVKNTLDKAVGLYNEAIKNPETFDSLVQRFSQTTTAITGGDLGYQPRTRLTLEYFEAINGKKPGSITNPFRSQFGIHIVKVLGVKTFKQIDMELYKKIVYDVKRDKILEDYFADKRKKAKVKVYTKELQ